MKTIHKNWLVHFKQELQNTSEVRIISPFITVSMAKELIKSWNGDNILIITRFNLNDFNAKVSSIEALEILHNNGATIIGIKELHSKVYIFDKKSAIITSANFTNGGFFSNYEFGVITQDQQEVIDTIIYFEKLWEIGGVNILSETKINDWKKELSNINSNIAKSILPDYGESIPEKIIDKKKRYFVKFYGNGNNRASLKERTEDQVKGTHCHFSVTFPKTKDDKRPRKFRDGDIIYIARMVEGQDYAIFGRAIARKHDDNRDVASGEDIKQIEWKEQYPIYIRVHSGVFLDTTFENCPRLQHLMSDLKGESFSSTKRKYLKGDIDINPKASLKQKAYIELSEEGAIWLEQKFEEAKNNYPLLSDSFINSLYQGIPEVK